MTFREEALERFRQTGLPSKKSEAYKYSPISGALKNIDLTGDARSNEVPIIDGLPERLFHTEGHHIVFVNGNFSRELSSDYRQIPFEAGNLTETFLRQHCKYNEDPFALLNHSSFRSGFLFKTGPGQQVEAPVIITHLFSGNGGPIQSHVKNVFVVQKNSSIQVVENFVALDNVEVFDTTSLHCTVEEGASMEHYITHTEKNTNQIHVGFSNVVQKKDSRYRNVTVSLDGKMIRNNLYVNLEAEGCHTDLYGLYTPTGKNHIDNYTTVDHRIANSSSNELYKGIIDDQASGVFNGRIFVRPDAQNTNAFQSNKNILLTENVTVHAKPQLEIWADDVKCSHGCTSGQLDDASLFYLCARGLNKQQARALLLKAFTSEVINEINIVPLRERLDKILETKLLKDVY